MRRSIAALMAWSTVVAITIACPAIPIMAGAIVAVCCAIEASRSLNR